MTKSIMDFVAEAKAMVPSISPEELKSILGQDKVLVVDVRDAPGFAFETLEWIKQNEIAAIASDTWGCEVRPNDSVEEINQPWHWITIPIMGITMGEIFSVAELADDCAEDGVNEFMFVAPAIPITGAVGSPTNPLAIK